MNKSYLKESKKTLSEIYSSLKEEYDNLPNTPYDMTRGKPCTEQLNLSDALLTELKTGKDCLTKSGFDVRNYGNLAGIDEAREFFAELLNLEKSNVIIGGNSSLTMMYDTLVRNLLFGTSETSIPWIKQGEICFLCPCPGYDRHFGMLEDLGIKMIPVPLTGSGPDISYIKKQLSENKNLKGMFCVPKYSNPTGECYDRETIKALATLDYPNDFRIFYDNAYIVHDFDEEIVIDNIFDYTKGTKNENLVYEFVSTSKMTHPGSGIACFASSKENIDFALKHMNYQAISSDKVNQLRQIRFFKNVSNLKKHMKKHGKILMEKFDIVKNIFSSELDGLEIAHYTNPNGGYFIGLYTYPHTAQRVYELCQNVGLKLTKVGAAFPYGKDPNDSFLRICPSYMENNNLRKASKILTLCVKIAALEKLFD